MRDFVETNSFNAVAAGQTATLDLPVGAVLYHGLRLHYGVAASKAPKQATMVADIKAIRLVVDGLVQRSFSAAELFALNALNNREVHDGVLPIFFSEPWRRNVLGEDALAWGTADVDTFQVEVDIREAVKGPKLFAKALTERVEREMGPIVKWRDYSIPVTAIGKNNWITAPKKDAYYRIHAFSEHVREVTVAIDQRRVFAATREQVNSLYDDLGLSPQEKVFHIVFDPTQRAHDALPMTVGSGNRVRRISEFRIDFDMASAESFRVVTETLGERD